MSRNQANNGDLGLKVVGGRHSGTRRLGAFITRVKPGSVADAVGQLRAGKIQFFQNFFEKIQFLNFFRRRSPRMEREIYARNFISTCL